MTDDPPLFLRSLIATDEQEPTYTLYIEPAALVAWRGLFVANAWRVDTGPGMELEDRILPANDSVRICHNLT